MKKLLPHITSIVLVTVGFVLGAILTGDNVIAQKLAALTGSGTSGKLAKWTSLNNLGDSSISEDKNGIVTVPGGIRFSDGSVQTSAGLGGHLKQLKFTLAPGQVSPLIDLPQKDCPVRLELTTTGELLETYQGQTFLNSPLVVTCMVSQNSITGHIGFIGSFFSGGQEQVSVLIGFNFDTADDFFTGLHIGSFNANHVTSPTINYCLNMWY